MPKSLDDILKPHENRKKSIDRRFYDANKRLEARIAEIDKQVELMTDFMSQLEDLNHKIIEMIQKVPRCNRTVLEQSILKIMIGDAAND